MNLLDKIKGAGINKMVKSQMEERDLKAIIAELDEQGEVVFSYYQEPAAHMKKKDYDDIITFAKTQQNELLEANNEIYKLKLELLKLNSK